MNERMDIFMRGMFFMLSTTTTTTRFTRDICARSRCTTTHLRIVYYNINCPGTVMYTTHTHGVCMCVCARENLVARVEREMK